MLHKLDERHHHQRDHVAHHGDEFDDKRTDDDVDEKMIDEKVR